MKQLPNLNKKEEDFLSNLLQLMVEYSKQKDEKNFKIPGFSLSFSEFTMIKEIASKVTQQ